MIVNKIFLLIFLVLLILILIKCDKITSPKESEEYGSIKGKITNTNGDPIRGANVSIENISSGKDSEYFTTGADGCFLFENVKIGEYKVSAEKEGYLSEQKIVTVQKDKPSSADLVLKKRETEKGIICGKVLDENSDPIEGVLLSTEPATHTDHTNYNGEYRLENISPGNYVVKAFKSGYRENNKSLTVEPNSIHILDLPLISNASLNALINGRITDAQTGGAIKDVNIETDPASHTALSDTNGYFQITIDHSNIPPYIYLVKAKKGGYNESSVQTSVQKGNVSIVNISLFKKGSGPEISDIQVSNITSSSATISWRTNTASDSRIEYGPTTNMNNQPKIDYSYTTYHQVTLEDLLPNTMYYYRVGSCDANGLTWSGQQTFTTKAEFLNETEPNDYKFQASEIKQEGVIFGTIGMNNDIEDWFVFSVNEYGRQKVKIENISENNIGGFGNITFLNRDGDKILEYTTSYSFDNIDFYQDIAPGKFYIRIQQANNNENAEYKIVTDFNHSSMPSDKEPNNKILEALNYYIESAVIGLIGYNNFVDYHDEEDYYKFIISQNGRLTIKATNIRSDKSGGFGQLTLLNEEGSIINDRSTGHLFGEVEFYQDLAPGTYYIKIRCTNDINQTAEYKIETIFNPPAITSDQEPNNNLLEALNYSINGTVIGLIGYNNFFDYHDEEDYYKFSISQNGCLKIKAANIRSDNSGGFNHVGLLNQDGTIVKDSYTNYSYNNVEFSQDIAPGNYFIKIACIHQNLTAEYRIETIFNPPSTASDNEPNDNLS